MAESMSGLLRVRGGTVEYRRLNAQFWKPLVPLQTLLALAPPDAPSTPADESQYFYRQVFTPDGRDLVADGWSATAPDGFEYTLPLVKAGGMSFSGDDFNVARRTVPVAEYKARMRFTLDTSDRIDLTVIFTDSDGNETYLGLFQDGPDGVLFLDLTGQSNARIMTLEDGNSSLTLDVDLRGAAITINGRTDPLVTPLASGPANITVYSNSRKTVSLREFVVAADEDADVTPIGDSDVANLLYASTFTPDNRDLVADGFVDNPSAAYARPVTANGALVRNPNGQTLSQLYRQLSVTEFRYSITWSSNAEPGIQHYVRANSPSSNGISFFPARATDGSLDMMVGDLRIPPDAQGRYTMNARAEGSALTLSSGTSSTTFEIGTPAANATYLGFGVYGDVRIHELKIYSLAAEGAP